MSERLRDIDTVLDYIAGSTGGANRPMPSQLAASQAARRLRRALAAAPSTPEPGIDAEVLAVAMMNTLPDILDWEMHTDDLAAEYARLASNGR